MAKYNLKTMNKSVDCDILNESNGKYIVQFRNGVIKGVEKRRVHSLNEIDSAVLDKVKDFGRRTLVYGKNIYNKVKNWFIETFNLGGFLFFISNGKILNASSPVNAMAAATTKDFINVIPSKAMIELADENGIEPVAVQNFEYEGEYSGALFGSNADAIEESVKTKKGSKVLEAYTDKQINDMISLSAYEKGEKNKDENNKIFYDYSQQEILDKLTSQFYALHGVDGFVQTNPLLIWGAPGVGKTAMVRELVETFKKNGYPNVNFVAMNVAGMGPEDVALPVSVDDKSLEKNTSKIIQKMLDKGVSMTKKVKDLPKSWLPVYDPSDANVGSDSAEVEEFKKELDAIANGGKYNKETGKIEGDDGGILFLDELSRMPQSVQNALMQLPTTRELGAQGLKLGSKWLIVAAANRPDDMPNNEGRNLMKMALAEDTRYTAINYVPDFETWEVWARDNKKGNIVPEIIDFLSIKENRKYFYMANRRNLGPSAKLAKATPRSWENLSRVLRNYCNLKKVASIKDADEAVLIKLCSTEIGGSVTSKEGNYHMGPGEAFVNYLKSNVIEFNDTDAENVWKGNLKDVKVLDSVGTFSEDFKTKAFKDTIVPSLIRMYPYKDKGGFINPALAMNLVKFAGEYSIVNNKADSMVFNQIMDGFLNRYQYLYDNGEESFMDRYNKTYDDVYNYIQNTLGIDVGF